MPVEELVEPRRGEQPKTSLPSPMPDPKREAWKEKKNRREPEGATAFFGWLSIGLGVTELLFPRTFAAIVGTPKRPLLTRLMGMREIGAGIGLLNSNNPAGWMKARVAGDALDILLLKRSWDSRHAGRIRLSAAMAAGAAITTADIAYARKLSRQQAPGGQIRIEASLAVNKSPEECYRFWRRFENLQRFMKSVKSVQPTGEKTQRWTISVPGERTMHWESETVQDTPDQTIAWRAAPGGDVDHSGMVQFERRLSGPGTMVRLSMQFMPPVGVATVMPNGLIEMYSEHRMREDLRRFKNVIETGETPTIEGQTSGRASKSLGGQR